MPSVYEIIIRTTERRLANEIKRRVDRYDMNHNAEIKAIHKDHPRCPKCKRVLRKEELLEKEGIQKHSCGEIIDFEI